MKIFHFYALAIIIGIGYATAGPQNKLTPRIINGYSCKTTQVPYLVIVQSRVSCGGTLITYEWVLTAAHCIIPWALKDITTRIHAGFDMPPHLIQERNAKEFHMHPLFFEKFFFSAKDFRHDIGLILLDKPFRQTIATQVATLPAPGFASQCRQALAPETGLTYNKEEIWDSQVKHRPVNCVNLTTVDTKSCKKLYEKGRGRIYFDNTVMCVRGYAKGICNGDSGGPVLCDNVIIGLVSMGPTLPSDCESTEIPSTATITMVEKYLDFIDNIVKFSGVKMN